MKQRVYAESNRNQLPQYGNLSGEGQFVFQKPGGQMMVLPPRSAPEPTIREETRQTLGSIAPSSSIADVEVCLGDRRLGVTRSDRVLIIENLPVGTYRVKARKVGQRDWEQEVRVAVNQRTEVVINIEPLRYDSSRLRPSSERSTYTVGDKWIRSDGEYELIKIEKDRYIFAAGADREIHLTKDLLVRKMQKGGWTTEFDSLPTLSWPLKVGSWGTGMGNWQIPPDAPSDRRSLLVRYTWSVEAYEDVHVPAGTFKAFRIVLSWEPQATDVITTSTYPRRQLVSWYAPEVRQLVKGEAPGLGTLGFQVIAVDRPKRTTPE